MEIAAEHEDQLLNCLHFILKLHGRSIHPNALRATIPQQEKNITPGLFIQAADKVGFAAHLVQKPIKKISSLLLPAVLLFKDGEACVLTKIDRKRKTGTISFGDSMEEVPLEKLEENYSGAVIYVKKKFEFDKRSDQAKMFKPSSSWFWDTFWRFKDIYLKVLAGSVMINLFVLAIPLFVMNVYDRVVPNKAFDTLWVLTIGMLIVITFDVILKVLRSYFVDVAGKKADIIISTALLDHSLNSVMESQPESAGVRANYIKEFEFVREFFSSATLATFVDLPFIFLFILVIKWLDGMLFLIPLIGVLLVIGIAAILSFPLYEAIKKSYVGSTQKNAVLVEALTGIEEIKSASAQPYFIERWQRFTTLTSSALLDARLYYTLTNTLTAYSAYIVTIGVVVYGVYLISKGELTTGGLIACTVLANRAMAPLGQITGLLNRYQQARCSLKALDSLMKQPVDREVEKRYTYIENLQGGIEIENLSFQYPDQKNPFFQGLNLKVKPGEKIAILGTLGSGKSTLLKVIDGLYSPTEGTVRIDGIDIRQIDPLDLRKNIGYLSQRPTLFFGSARSNIVFKAPYVEDSQVIEAINLSGASQFISKHPDGLGMQIGEAGKGLSGGQIQMIALARTLLLNPKLLLLDEPTSSLDSGTEALFINNLKKYLKGRTALIVTHKMALLELVDRIVVIHQGKVVKDGPRDKIMKEISKTAEA